MRRVVSKVLLVGALVGAPGVLAADEGEELVEVSDGQLDLNDRGVDAIAEGDYERAIRLFEASLDLGELNVTYTNLGRAYQRAGMCRDAEKAFQRALTDAPRAGQPTPEQIEQAIEAYRAEMDDTCPGHLEVECTPWEMTIFIDDDGPHGCADDKRYDLMPDVYEVRGKYEGNEVSAQVAIRPLQVMRVSLDLSHVDTDEGEAVAQVEAEPLVEDEPAPEFEAETVYVEPAPRVDEEPVGSTATSWLLVAGSSLSLAGGVALDTIPHSSRNGQVDPINFVPVGLYAASIAMAWMGVRKLRR